MFTYRALLASKGFVYSISVEVEAASSVEAIAAVEAMLGYGEMGERIVSIRPYTKEEKD